MKKFVQGMTLVSILFVFRPVHAGKEVNFNRGFCVPKGVALRKENAVLVIEAGIANRSTMIHPGDHLFFSPESTESLHGGDWGGNFTLEKAGEVNGYVSTCVLESHTHALKIKRQLVLCVADDAPNEYQVFGNASVNACDVFGGARSAREVAEAQAKESAQAYCASLGRTAQTTGVRVVSANRGSCWAGDPNTALVELRYICQ